MGEYVARGGISMWLVLAFGVSLCFAAARFARSPAPRKLPLLGTLALATITATLHGMLMDVGLWLDAPERGATADLARTVKVGALENVPPAGLGGALLCVATVLVAIGAARLAAKAPPPLPDQPVLR